MHRFVRQPRPGELWIGTFGASREDVVYRVVGRPDPNFGVAAVKESDKSRLVVYPFDLPNVEWRVLSGFDMCPECNTEQIWDRTQDYICAPCRLRARANLAAVDG